MWLPTGSGKSICLPFMFDKKLGRDNILVVVIHRYFQQLSPTSAAHVCTSDKRVEADRRLTALETLRCSLILADHRCFAAVGLAACLASRGARHKRQE